MLCPRCGTANLPGSDQCDRCQLDLAPLDRPAGQDRVEQCLIETTVSTLPLKPPLTVPLSATARDAMAIMCGADVGAVLIVDDAGKLAGILTERDLLHKFDPGDEGHPVREFMSPDPETVTPADTLAFVLFKMDVGGFRHVPVVEAGKPISIVSVRGMIRHIIGLCRD